MIKSPFNFRPTTFTVMRAFSRALRDEEALPSWMFDMSLCSECSGTKSRTLPPPGTRLPTFTSFVFSVDIDVWLVAVALSEMITISASPTLGTFGSENSEIACPQADCPPSSIDSSTRVHSRCVLVCVTLPTLSLVFLTAADADRARVDYTPVDDLAGIEIANADALSHAAILQGDAGSFQTHVVRRHRHGDVVTAMHDGDRLHVPVADDLTDTDGPRRLQIIQIFEGIEPTVLQGGDVALLHDEGIRLQQAATADRTCRDDDIAEVATVDGDRHGAIELAVHVQLQAHDGGAAEGPRRQASDLELHLTGRLEQDVPLPASRTS